jgi:hypothetical protein
MVIRQNMARNFFPSFTILQPPFRAIITVTVSTPTPAYDNTVFSCSTALVPVSFRRENPVDWAGIGARWILRHEPVGLSGVVETAQSGRTWLAYARCESYQKEETMHISKVEKLISMMKELDPPTRQLLFEQMLAQFEGMTAEEQQSYLALADAKSPIREIARNLGVEVKQGQA